MTFKLIDNVITGREAVLMAFKITEIALYARNNSLCIIHQNDRCDYK